MQGDTAVRTGDASTGLTKDWSGAAMQKEVAAQMAITSNFGQQASKAVGDYATGKAKELRSQDNEAEAVKWDEGGEYRALAHTAIGGLAGGVGGALGAGSAALAAPMIDAATAGLPDGVKNVVGAAIAAGIGAATGGGLRGRWRGSMRIRIIGRCIPSKSNGFLTMPRSLPSNKASPQPRQKSG